MRDLKEDGRRTAPRVLILEDETFILMDLEHAFADAEFTPIRARSNTQALKAIEAQVPDVAILDANLGNVRTCEPTARRLTALGVPFLLHTGDLERQGELVTRLDAPIISKPSLLGDVVLAVGDLVTKTARTGPDGT